MGAKLNGLIDKIRDAKGPFFVARVALRLRFPLAKADVPDGAEFEQQILDACRELGFDASALYENGMTTG